MMQEGKSKGTGHFMELRPCKGKNWRSKHWDFEKKVFIDDGPAKFAYCIDCKQYAWGWEPICPMNRKRSVVLEWVAD